MTILYLESLFIVSKFRWEICRCHNQDLVDDALVTRQIGDEETISWRLMVYKLVLQDPFKRSTPSKFLISKHFFLKQRTNPHHKTILLRLDYVPDPRHNIPTLSRCFPTIDLHNPRLQQYGHSWIVQFL